MRTDLPSYFKTLLIASEIVITAIVFFAAYKAFKQYKEKEDHKKDKGEFFGTMRRKEKEES